MIFITDSDIHLELSVPASVCQELELNGFRVGDWVDAPIGGYKVRIDRPKNDKEKLHVHIARNKHQNTKTKQVTWNVDGTRHDKKTFDVNFKGMEVAKDLARIVLDWQTTLRLNTA